MHYGIDVSITAVEFFLFFFSPLWWKTNWTITAENTAIMGKDMQIHEANRKPYYHNSKRPSVKHIIMKISEINDKERILKAAKGKKMIYKANPIRLSVDFSAETP